MAGKNIHQQLLNIESGLNVPRRKAWQSGTSD
jgi:hypothetical protein